MSKNWRFKTSIFQAWKVLLLLLLASSNSRRNHRSGKNLSGAFFYICFVFEIFHFKQNFVIEKDSRNFFIWLYSHLWLLQGYLYTNLLNCALRAKNVLMCQIILRAYVFTCLTCLSADGPTCLACLRAHVPTCFVCSRGHVPTCRECLRASRVNTSFVLMYSSVNVACDLTCSRPNMPRVSYFTRPAWPPDHLPTCFVSSVSSFDATLFIFIVIVVEVVQTFGKVQEFR